MRTNQKFCAVVKANAYGMGAKKVCEAVNDIVDYFAVSSEDEFLEVCETATKPILLLDPIYENITNLAKLNCEFCVSNFHQLKIILAEAEKNLSVKFKLHLAFNTGMNRFGFNRETEVLKVFKMIEKTQNVSIFSVFSHFYQGNEEIFVKIQAKRFFSLKKKLQQNFDLSNVIFHISNTAGFAHEKNFDMFRIGLGMFCYNNNYVFSLETKIIEIQTLKKHDTAGYGFGFVAKQKTKVAVCGVGYADGIPRKLAGVGYVLINGKCCKILAVCMDSIVVDVTNVNPKLLDKVTLIGKNGGKEISCCKFSSWCGTIDYEVMTSISSRVKRKYFGGVHADNNGKVPSEKTFGG